MTYFNLYSLGSTQMYLRLTVNIRSSFAVIVRPTAPPHQIINQTEKSISALTLKLAWNASAGSQVLTWILIYLLL